MSLLSCLVFVDQTKHVHRLSMVEHADRTLPSSRTNILTSYYTNVLLPKFRILNALPENVHMCSQQCVLHAEQQFLSNRIQSNPFLLPFECNWSIVASRPSGYRTPCRRILYSLDDIEQYLYRTQSKLSIKFFVDGVLTRFQPSMNDFKSSSIIHVDLCQGKENVAISIYNDVDHEQPEKFIYITENRSMDQHIAAALHNKTTISCCSCTDKCVANRCASNVLN
jgi:hypothetical protein